ncbi:beta-lactamase family protein [Crassaminicella thermophila]|uniref:Beta-lactamase family protein n=1 Tax=Crassaminicella thermophila TaxID=2599308 RepID=A0A5C0S9J8_CRATE|nr:serine hydrolase domain-containing protein [Crassaminicella thermophila]QEK11223.1 beta-lactamase family protein [Crassaminicella thermophila]
MNKEFEAFIEKMMFYYDIPGLAIGITKQNEIVYAKGFGVMNIKSNDPVTEETIFHMASITKTFVAAAVMQLVEKGKVDLNKPVVEYLPYFRLKDNRYKEITILQMLSHTSGIPDCTDYCWEKPEYDEDALERYVRSIEDISLLYEPGTKFYYSNIAYEVLGDLVSKVSGESFETYVINNILIPLEMKNSTLLTIEREPKLLASPHIKNEEKKVVVSKVYPYNRVHAPSSTLTSNILDICKWSIANLNRGELDGVRILKEDSYDVLWKKVANIKPNEEDIGISWFIRNYSKYKMVGHEGRDIGFRTSLGLIPKKYISVCVLANIDSAPTKKIMMKAFDSMLV